ncbi:MAG: hypothetical protein HKO57_13040, partial [Akkermansiaceae bacterium]|nr:hypothetical protein [Akkermansiaceae bacterium]
SVTFAVIQTTTTNASGLYVLEGFPPGDYIVEFEQPAGYEFSPTDNAGDDTLDSDPNAVNGRTGVYTVNPGDMIMTVDAGFFPPATISNLVWDDLDGDGVQDAGEPGIDGVEVRLYLAGDLSTTIGTTTTSGGGLYSFDNLVTEDYVVEFVTPAGYAPVPQDAGVDDAVDSDASVATGQTASISLAPGEANTNTDAGFYKPSSISDYVWNDINGNGVQDGGAEAGIDGVTVNLLDPDNGFAVLATTTTAGGGAYSFTGLGEGNYVVEFVTPGGYVITPQDQGGDDALDSDAAPANGRTATIVLAADTDNTDVDAGFFQPSSIGDRIWNDIDGDGQQGPGETAGLSGVTVRLLDPNNGFAVLATTISGATGDYSFTGLPAGDYVVEFVKPGGYAASPQDQGGDDAADSDAAPADGRTATIALGSNQTVTNVDAGFFDPGTISDFVWNDLNGDGVQDGGEPGLDGVTVNLLDATGTVTLATTTTSGGGAYSFGGLGAADYIVEFVLPAGYNPSPQGAGSDPAVDSDADILTGRSGTVTVTAGATIDDIDAGFWNPGTIGDFVWRDRDADGIQDAGEPGLAGVTVNLLDFAGTTTLLTTTTNGAGAYSFGDLVAGDYLIEFVAPAGFDASPQGAGSDAGLDSDADTGTGRTGTVTVAAGQTVDAIDAGFYDPKSNLFADFVGLYGLTGADAQPVPD